MIRPWWLRPYTPAQPVSLGVCGPPPNTMHSLPPACTLAARLVICCRHPRPRWLVVMHDAGQPKDKTSGSCRHMSLIVQPPALRQNWVGCHCHNPVSTHALFMLLQRVTVLLLQGTYEPKHPMCVSTPVLCQSRRRCVNAAVATCKQPVALCQPANPTTHSDSPWQLQQWNHKAVHTSTSGPGVHVLLDSPAYAGAVTPVCWQLLACHQSTQARCPPRSMSPSGLADNHRHFRLVSSPAFFFLYLACHLVGAGPCVHR